ncbi:MAG: ABC transporter permease [Armatimonadota bacterium]|nr:ABC transporter permease [Armatimonadota bacterium]MDR7426136.1 ABC transporter permease [Armatimonadota bacterium]MDR7463507.1 ABC transporter permease [Armatimonadota bacterium]MDR7471050.1 ABC transporter permease [Armatimonadota bacterium]MDR7475337.1 ABC transporter permease [Armatimonadota bacterium]
MTEVARPGSARSAFDLRLRGGLVGRWLLRRPLTLVGAGIVLLVSGTGLWAPLLAPYDPLAISIAERLQPLSLAHPLGTDHLGRDLLSRIIHGARVSMGVGVSIAALGALIGTVLGLLAGFLGGKVDEAIMRVCDMFLAFPALILAMALAASLGPSLGNTMLALVIIWWPWYARIMRGQVLALRESEYVMAARALGAGTGRLMFRHLLPNAIPPIIVQATLDVGNAILIASSLSFLGFGAQPPVPEWGAITSEGRTFLRDYWWYPTFPGLAIMVTVMGFNLMGDGLRDLLDPRLRRQVGG